MNLEQYLLNKLAEEANEVSQAALKAAQMGLESYNPKENNTSDIVIERETNDVLGTLEALKNLWEIKYPERDMLFEGVGDKEAIQNKEVKIVFYAQHALDRGCLTLDDQDKVWYSSVVARNKK